MQQVNVGVIGFGTVGAGAVEVLLENRDIIENRAGFRIVLKKIADLDIDSDRGVAVDPALLTTRAEDVIHDPEVQIVVELMGGVTKAREYILRSMENGKHVVTANKALLAEHGEELYMAADRHAVNLAFEASVCGGIPVVDVFRRGLSSDRLETIMGIVNGTSNYILTKMTQEGLSFERAVQEAIHLGFAEDPPTLDVNGTDAAHKLAILMSIAFGAPVSLESIFKEGIDKLSPDDIDFARKFGYSVKLLAIARRTAEGFEARVHPAMIPRDHMLANVIDEHNAVYIEGDFIGPNLYFGLGAGRRPTGSAVVSDIMDLAAQINAGIRPIHPPLGYKLKPERKLLIKPIEKLNSAYYFRVSALDSPGVLSKISGVLGENNISISSVIQKGREVNSSVPIVMLTHEAREHDVRKALSIIDNMDIVTSRTAMIRVELGS